MWWRFLAFCVLVTLVLFVVLSCVYGRPVVHLFFHRCCGEDIENDQVIYESFGNNFLRERLVGTDALEAETTAFSFEEVERVIHGMRSLINVHDPTTRDAFYELGDEMSTEDDPVMDVTTERLRKRGW
ncbi:unnamed protein product, partial [Iphiclides podalirius]